jgi:hypothetical protein
MAAWTGGEASPRLVVTSLEASETGAQHLDEKIDCARGGMVRQSRSAEPTSEPDERAGQRPDPGVDRTSTATMRANQLRLRLLGIGAQSRISGVG